jgi:hypothetical protein
MKRPLLFLFLLVFVYGNVFAQSPGTIVRPAGVYSSTVLNPDGNGFSSSSSSGFTTSDITQSEILYKTVPPVFLEPTSDLLRGPGDLYSDLVRQVDGSGFYVYNDGTNLLFRLRLGSIVSGSKGYSVLIDTDGKMGNTGPYADPDYQAATTGVNGNPGFELEITLETNFRVAAYNVAGSSSPTLINSYGINTNSQISVALSTVSGTPDYFYDFYVPISILGITNSTPLRMVATTVMSPMAAIGGPKSDIFGVNDASYNDPMKSWETVINNTPTVTLTNLTSGGSGGGSVCTAAPTIASSVTAGSGITITGSWTALDGTKPQTATITLYKNGSSAGTTTVTSGNTWSVTGITVVANDVLYAKAQASGESQCLQSANVVVTTCSAANTSSAGGLTFTCSADRGMDGTRTAGTSIKLYRVTSSGITLLADDATTTYKVTYPTSTTWRYDDANGQGNASACSGGAPELSDGSYMGTATESGKCESGGIFTCVTLSAAATPTITQTTLYNGASTMSGTSVAGATVRLYKNGTLRASTTADGSGNYSFTGLGLVTGDVMTVMAQTSTTCISASATRTVTCFTTPPVMTADANGTLSTGSTTISGKSGETTGTVVTVYENGVSIGTTTVQSGGTWSLTYTPVAGRGYTATQQNGSCAVSTASTADTARAATTVCATITGSYTSANNSVTGTLPSAFTGKIRLYIDGVRIDSVSVSSAIATTWTISNLNSSYSDTLYPGGVLTVTTQATTTPVSAEKTDCSGSVTVGCALPTTPVISPTSSTIQVGQSVTYGITSTQSGVVYSVVDATSTTTNYAVSKWGTNGSLNLPTNTFTTAGTYNVLVSAISVSGVGCSTTAAASIVVNSALPITLSYFTGRYANNRSQLGWETVTEENVDYFAVERSNDGRQFTQIGTVKATGNSVSAIKYTYNDNTPLNGTAWYRLRTVDNDLKAEYSNVIRLTNTANSLLVLSVTPNPFESNMRMQVYSAKTVPAAIRITDINGRELYKTNKVFSPGNNTISLSPPASLATGMYILQVINGREVIWKQKVQKVK